MVASQIPNKTNIIGSSRAPHKFFGKKLWFGQFILVNYRVHVTWDIFGDDDDYQVSKLLFLSVI